MVTQRFRAILTAAAALVCAVGSAGAAEIMIQPPLSEPVSQGRMGQWYCFDDLSQFAALTFDSSDVQINNIALAQETEVITDAPRIVLSASLINRSKRDVSASLEFLGVARGSALFLVSASPILPISPGRNEVVQGETYAPLGTAEQIERGCLRVVGYRSAEDAPTR